MRLIICSFLLSVLGCSEHKIESVSDPNATGDTASMTQTTTSSTSTTGTTTTGTTTGTSTTPTTSTSPTEPDECSSIRFEVVGSGMVVANAEMDVKGASRDCTDEYTVEAWLYIVDNTGSQTVSRHGRCGAYHLLEIQDGDVTFTTEYLPYLRHPMPTEEWVHVAGTYAGGQLSMYVNGTLVDQAEEEAGTHTDYMQLHHVGTHFGGYITQGWIDVIRISNGLRYTSDFTPTVDIDTDAFTASLWTFSEGSGSIAEDSSGNGFHGNLTYPLWGEVCAE